MAKSKYPQALDTSKELPPVRDNITEIGSEVINSLRAAIINIEKTLGINPQGATGNSVSSRINTSLDDTGNIRKEALTKANVLSGPITNVDVADTAAIAEKKLRLNFPTQILQDQVSILNGELDALATQITDLNATISVHVHPDATNRHKAVAITVAAATLSESSEAFTSLETGGTLQEVMEDIVNGHINFAGNVSSVNNSHTADQIYFDTTEVEDIIFQDTMQGAMEDLANLESVGLRNNTLNLASNGRIRTGSVYDAYEENNLGDTLIASSNVSFVREGSRTRFSFEDDQTPLSTVKPFDYLNLSNSDTEDDNKSYQIAEIVKTGDDISAVVVFGLPLGESIAGLTATVTKNPYVTYNINALNSTVRPRADKSNTPDIVIANPNAATIISTGIRPSEIESDAHTFDIVIDGGTAITIDTYDENVTEQTLSSIVNKINEQAVDQNLNFLAYRARSSSCYELALAHTLPNYDGDVANRTLEVQAGASDDGTDILGFDDILDTEYEGVAGNTYHINGYLYETFGKMIELTSSDIFIVEGTNTLTLYSDTFEEKGVRVGDLLVITGSETTDDDGTYRISNVNEETITLDSSSLELTGALDSDSLVQILRVSAAVSEMNFTEAVSSNGSIVFDTFISEDQDVHYHKRLEVDGAISSGGFSAAVVDVSKGFIKSGQKGTVTVTTEGYATLTDPTLRVGESIYVGHTGIYRLLASDGLSYLTIAVNSNGLPSTEQIVDVYGFDELNTGNLRTCRGTFATSLGRVLGEYAGVGVPSVLDKRRSGTVDETIISESLLEKYIEGPRNELRSHGIIRGLRVSNANLVNSGEQDELGNDIFYYEVDIDAGVAIVNGIRYELPGYTAFRFNTEEDFYIAVDPFGCIVYGDQIANPDGYTDGYIDQVAPFADQELAYLAFIDSNDNSIIDLRFFVDRLDLKSGRIIVSKTQNFGHFTDVADAIQYARRFTELHPKQGTPMVYIDQGNYEVDGTIVVDFDVKICGAGPDTVISKTGSFAQGTQPSSGNIDFGDTLFLIGATSEAGAFRMENGVTLSDFTYEVSDELEAVGCVISITHPSQKSNDFSNRQATFRIQNINFLGNSLINYGTGADDNLVGEYAIAIGQTDESNFTPVSDIKMGGVIVTGCRFDRMGVEKGAIKFSESADSTFSNIVIANNIATLLSPNEGDDTFEILETPTTPTLAQVIESNNART